MTKPNIIKSIKFIHQTGKMGQLDAIYTKHSHDCKKVNFIIGRNGSGKTRLMVQILCLLNRGFAIQDYEHIRLIGSKKGEPITNNFLDVTNISMNLDWDVFEDRESVNLMTKRLNFTNSSLTIDEYCFKLHSISTIKPDILFWEHPETGLDLQTQSLVIAHILTVHPNIKQIFITTHSPEVVGCYKSSTILHMSDVLVNG